MFIDTAPNFERPGVVTGFVLGVGSGLTPSVSKGVLFAQGAIYRPAAAPALPAAPASQQSWLFYNALGGFYFLGAPVAAASGDALVGWVRTNANAVIAVSRQRIELPEPTDNLTVIPLGAVLPQGSGNPAFGDTDVPGQPVFGIFVAGRGTIEFQGLAFVSLINTSSIDTAAFRILYREESAGAASELTADVASGVTGAATVFPVGSGAAFTIGNLYAIGNELVKVTAINGNQLTVERGQISSVPAPHAGPKAITGASNATPIVITSAAHERANGSIVKISGVGGNTAANESWQAENVSANTLELFGSSGNGAYTGGGTIGGAPLYAVQEKISFAALQPEFFGTPASGNWSHAVELPSAVVKAVECWVVNAFGASPSKVNLYDVRTLAGGQIMLESEGLLAIQGDIVPEIPMPYTAAADFVWAYVKQAPIGGKITLVVKLNGASWATLTIGDGQLNAVGARTGRALGVLPEGAKIGLDITSVGAVFPGERLAVQIAL
jgi:hypothetical protein